jgi:hypothetical protein
MADHPRWNYWIDENLGDGRLLPVDDDGWLPKGDIRKDTYNLDTKKWCRKHLWTAEQAALISFSRDPYKVLTDNDLIPWNDEHHEEHAALAKHINKLYRLITDAQEQRILPEIFRPGMYIEWAKHVGVDFPPYIEAELDAVERERSRNADSAQQSDDVVSNNTERTSEKKGRSQQTRLENNLRKIILALLIKAGLTNEKPDALSRKLEDILLKEDTPYPKAGTIEERLTEVLDLLK